jgi:SEL1 protein
MPGGDDYYDEIDDGVLESLLIVSLTAVLAFLVYYRQQRQVQQRNQQQQQQRPPDVNQQYGQGQNQEHDEDRGLFPRADDPEFINWAAGGIGH